jgi:hypothetical protein
MTGMQDTSTSAGTLYRIEAVEEAVKATIRQVTSPAVRQAMWDAWTEAADQTSAGQPGVMPWESARPKAATVITEHQAHAAMVKVLESITDSTSLQRRIRDILALEAEFIEPEGAEGIRRECQHCGRPYRAKTAQSRYCRTGCRQAAFKKRKRAAERDREQIDSQQQPGTP